MRRYAIPGLFFACLAATLGPLALGQSPPKPIPAGIPKYVPGSGYTAAVAGTDYVAPNGSGAALTGITAAQIGGVPAGLLKGSGGAIAAAAAGTDYLTPSGNGAALTNITAANIAAGTAGISVTGNAGTATALAGSVAANRLWGGNGTGAPSAVTVGSGLTLSGGTLTASGGGAPARTYYLSANGGTADVDFATGLKVGGGAATDNAAAVNAVLAGATAAAPVKLVVDGAYAVGSPVLIPAGGHVTIEGIGWDSGFFCLPGTNGPAVTNENLNAAPFNPFDPGPPAPSVTTQGNVVIRNLRVHHNRGTYPNGNSSSGAGKDARGVTVGPWYCPIDLATLQNVRLDHVWVYDPCTFAVRLNNCQRVWVTDSAFESPNRSGNTDGVHVDGACQYLFINNCYFKTGDDAIAVNADEGYSTQVGQVIVRDIFLDDCDTGPRIHGSSKAVYQAVFDGVVGSTRAYCFNFGNSGTAMLNRSISVSNCRVKVGNTSPVAQFTSGFFDATFSNVMMSDPGGATPIATVGNNVNIGHLSFTDCSVYRTQFGGGDAYLLSVGGGKVGTLRVNGFAVVNQTGLGFAPVPCAVDIGGGSVTNLIVDGVSSQNLTAVVGGTGGMANVTYAGGSTRLTLKDSQALPGTVFIPADHADKLAVNVGGTLYPLTVGAAYPAVPHAAFAGVFSRAANSTKGSAMSVASNSTLQTGSGSFTVAAFGKLSATATFIRTLMMKAPSGASWEYMLFYLPSNSCWSFITGTSEVHSTTVPAIGAWSLVGGSFSAVSAGGDGKAHLWINGSEEGTPVTTTPLTGGSGDLVIGANTVDTTWGMDGSIAMAAKWPFALTSGQWAWLYNGGLGRSAAEITGAAGAAQGLSTPSFLYDFSDNTTPPNTLGLDRSGNGNHLTPRYATGPTQGAGPG